MSVVAITGATGFIGRRIALALREAGHEVRALVRRPDLALADADIRLVPGALEDESGLRTLLQGADDVVHAAGAVRANDRTAFFRVNAEGTERLTALVATVPGRRLILLSSLAARFPELSPYAASKAAGERAARQQAGGSTGLILVRPPAVYGPGDRATLPLIAALGRGWLIAPAGSDSARFSLLFVADLARLVVALLAPAVRTDGLVLEPDDGRLGGYGWRDLAVIAQATLQHPVRRVNLPRRPLAVLAALTEGVSRLSGRPPLLSRGKLAELCHDDWLCRHGGPATARAGWQPRTGFSDGLVLTLAGYREAGWVRKATSSGIDRKMSNGTAAT